MLSCTVGLLAVQLGLTVVPVLLTSLSQRESTTTTAGLVALALSLVVLAGCCATGIRRGSGFRVRGVALAAGLAGVAASAVAISGQGLTTWAVWTLPANALQALQLVAVGFVQRLDRSLMLIVATGPLAVLLLAPTDQVTLWQAVDQWCLPATSSIVLVILLSHLREGAVIADRAAELEQAEAARARHSEHEDRAAEHARRVLHDEVITALRSIELAMPRPIVERACDSALRSLAVEVPESRTDLATDLAAVPGVDVTVEGTAWPAPPSPRVVDAFLGAASEALRNVVRHAGTDAATLRFDTDGERLLLEVADRGHGLGSRGPGFGIRNSIVGRMAEVGGSADLVSDADGTTVSLSWPAAPSRRTPAREQRMLTRRVRAFSLAALAPIVAHLYVVLRFPGQDLVSGLTVWAAATALLLCVVRRQSRAPMGTPAVLAVAAVAGVIVALGLLEAGPGALLTINSWVIGYVAVTLALTAFEAPAPPMVAVLIGLVAEVLMAAWLDPTLGLLDPIGALLTPVLVVGSGIVLGLALHRADHALTRSRILSAAHEEEQAWHNARIRAREGHLAHLANDVVPFLEAVVDGPVDDTGDDPRLTATVLSAQCRDQLYLNEPLPQRARDVARWARSRGVTLTFRSTLSRGRVSEVAWAAIESVLARSQRGHTVTVVPGVGSGTVRITVVPPLTRLPAVPAEVAHDEVRTVLTVGAVSSDPATVVRRDEPVGSTS